MRFVLHFVFFESWDAYKCIKFRTSVIHKSQGPQLFISFFTFCHICKLRNSTDFALYLYYINKFPRACKLTSCVTYSLCSNHYHGLLFILSLNVQSQELKLFSFLYFYIPVNLNKQKNKKFLLHENNKHFYRIHISIP